MVSNSFWFRFYDTRLKNALISIAAVGLLIYKTLSAYGFKLVELYFIPETTTQCSELRVHIPSPPHSYSDASPQLSLCSDNTSSTSNCNSEPDQVSPHAERRARKKRKRTTFSPIEVWELERVYKRRGPYLMSTDEEELVQRLGISARSLKASTFISSNRRKARQNLS